MNGSRRNQSMARLGKTSVSIAVLASVLAWACSKAPSDVESDGQLQGTVIDQDQSLPLDKVTISTDPASRVSLSEPNGSFSLSGLPARAYSVTATREGYIPVTQQVSVSAGRNNAISFSLTKAKSDLWGKALDKNGLPIPYALISTLPATQTTQTKDDGSFVLQGVSPGKYNVIASKKGFRDATIEALVSLGQDNSASLTLETMPTFVEFTPSLLNFGTDQTSMALSIAATGLIAQSQYEITLPPSITWITLSQSKGAIGSTPAQVVVGINRVGLKAGNFSTNLSISVAGSVFSIPILTTVPAVTTPDTVKGVSVVPVVPTNPNPVPALTGKWTQILFYPDTLNLIDIKSIGPTFAVAGGYVLSKAWTSPSMKVWDGMVMIWNGSAWTTTSIKGVKSVASIQIVSKTEIYATGFYLDGVNEYYCLLKSDGVTWKILSTMATEFSESDKFDLSVVDATHFFVSIGYGGTYTTIYEIKNGAWTTVGAKGTRVKFFSKDFGIAAGGNGGWVYNGIGWVKSTTDKTNPDQVWIGNDSTFAFYDYDNNLGKVYSASGFLKSFPVGSAFGIKSMFTLNRNSIWIGGWSKIGYYDGSTFNVSDFPDKGQIKQMNFTNAKNGFALTGTAIYLLQ